MFTPLELAAVGLTEEKATAVYGESSVQVCREFYIVSACPGTTGILVYTIYSNLAKFTYICTLPNQHSGLVLLDQEMHRLTTITSVQDGQSP